jgi:hypothetical protein
MKVTFGGLENSAIYNNFISRSSRKVSGFTTRALFNNWKAPSFSA